jgi:hypothetical protein
MIVHVSSAPGCHRPPYLPSPEIGLHKIYKVVDGVVVVRVKRTPLLIAVVLVIDENVVLPDVFPIGARNRSDSLTFFAIKRIATRLRMV